MPTGTEEEVLKALNMINDAIERVDPDQDFEGNYW